MATPLEYRKKIHKEILKAKDQGERAKSGSDESIDKIKKIDNNILSLRKSITDMESMYGDTSTEAVDFKNEAESKILDLERDKDSLNIARDLHKKEFDRKSQEKKKKQFQRKHKEKIDGIPKYLDIKDKNLKFLNNLNLPIDWANKTIRHFKEDVPKKVQNFSLAALSIVVLGTAAYKNKDTLNDYFFKDKRSIEKEINLDNYPKYVKDLLKIYPNVEIQSLKFLKEKGEVSLFLPEVNLTIYFDRDVELGYFQEMNTGEGKLFYNH